MWWALNAQVAVPSGSDSRGGSCGCARMVTSWLTMAALLGASHLAACGTCVRQGSQSKCQGSSSTRKARVSCLASMSPPVLSVVTGCDRAASRGEGRAGAREVQPPQGRRCCTCCPGPRSPRWLRGREWILPGPQEPRGPGLAACPSGPGQAVVRESCGQGHTDSCWASLSPQGPWPLPGREEISYPLSVRGSPPQSHFSTVVHWLACRYKHRGKERLAASETVR